MDAIMIAHAITCDMDEDCTCTDRERAYAEGFHRGRHWAEVDIQRADGSREYWSQRLREDSSGPHALGSERAAAWKAEALGAARGYRDTWARWDDGRLTWQMLEHAPVGS